MFKKNAKSNRKVVSIAVLLSTSLLAFTVFASGSFKQVVVEVNSRPVYYAYTDSETVGQLLSELKIDVKSEDNFDLNLERKIVDNDVIGVNKTNKVIINDANESFEIYTTKNTVGDLIDEGIININDKVDFMNMNSYDEIVDNMTINITRVTSRLVSEESAIPFETVKKETSLLPKDEVRIISEGTEGVMVTNTETIYHNGVEVDTVITTRVEKNPKNRVVEYGNGDYAYGTKLENINYSRVLSCSATAYCACSRCCGWSTGITASGMRAQYGVVAVDPRVIPLGTKLYIETDDGSYAYGYSVAADTGGAIKGNKVDLFFPSHSDALKFGRRNVKVYIMS